MRSDMWAGTLSWCNIQVGYCHTSGLFQCTAFLKRDRISWYNCLFTCTIWPWGTNSWWTMPFQSKKQNQNDLELWLTHPCSFWFVFALYSPTNKLGYATEMSLSNFYQDFYQACRKISHPHTHTCTHAHMRSSISFNVTMTLIQWTACAHAQFSGCNSTTNAHSKIGQMAVCCQNLTLGALSNCSALSVLERYKNNDNKLK
jgi:hypothetical protein